MTRRLAQIVGWLAIVPFIGIALLALTTPMTWSGLCYLVGLGVVIAGLATARMRTVRRRGITRAGLLVLLLTIVARMISGASSASISMHAREGESARLIDRLIDEKDLALTATRALVATGILHDYDAPKVVPAMRSAYERMREAEHDAPSPVMATYLGLQSPDASDTLVVEPPGEARAALIFLHGFAGNFTLPCWELARAVADLGVVTVCPSVGYRGDWWTHEGQETLTRTVSYVRGRGIQHIHLAGLSNGAVGASRLALRMPGVFEGMILISGGDPSARPPGLPLLVLQGRHDTMMPVGISRGYARRSGARYVELDAGHFAMLVCGDETHGAISTWMSERLR